MRLYYHTPLEGNTTPYEGVEVVKRYKVLNYCYEVLGTLPETSSTTISKPILYEVNSMR